jgi:hypothetical protein
MVLLVALPDSEHSRAARFLLSFAYLVAAWLWWRSGSPSSGVYLALRQSQEWKPAIAWLEAVNYRDWRIVLETVRIGLLVGSAVRGVRSASST